MSGVGQLWAALAEDERRRAALALLGTLGERGRQLAAALTREAEPGQRTTHTVRVPVPGVRQPSLIPEHAAGERLDRRCAECGRAVRVEELVAFTDRKTGLVRMLGPSCWRDLMLARARAEMPPGDVQQAFPTPMPITTTEG